jgi:hypothetical protein
MRLANAVHRGHPWRIHELAPDFTPEDVWALPAIGQADGFPTLLDVFANLDFPSSTSLPTRVLWGIRDLVGRWFDLGRIDGTAGPAARLPIPGTSQTSLAERLPDDLRGTAAVALGSPFTALYRTDDEYAAELSNRTVHAVLHLGWAEASGRATRPARSRCRIEWIHAEGNGVDRGANLPRVRPCAGSPDGSMSPFRCGSGPNRKVAA